MNPSRNQAIFALLALTYCAIGCGGGGASTEAGAGGGAAAGKNMNFTLPHVLNAEHPVSKALEMFAQEVGKRSDGQMTIKVSGGATRGSEQEYADNVSNNTDDFTKISFTELETKTELAKVYTLPFLFRDDAHMWKVFDGEIGQEMLRIAVDKNLRGICYFDAGARSFYTKKPITKVSDLRGLKIRVQKSVMMQKLIETLGAAPMQIDFSELYTAIDTGVVDGAENNIPSYFTQQHYKVAKYYVFDEHVRIPDVLLMSQSRWESLTPEQQQIIMDSAHAAQEFQRQLWREAQEDNIEKMKAEGVTFTQPENRQEFVDATAPIYDNQAPEILQIVERIRAVQ